MPTTAPSAQPGATSATPASLDTPSPASTMRAITADRYGSPQVLRVATVPIPAPGPDEVLVAVAAAGISRAALHLLTGTPLLLRLAGFGVRRPKQPVIGLELAGTVAAIGANVTRFSVGDEVFGYGSGACAEFSVADESKLAHKPAELSFVEASTLVDSASTALQAVVEHGEVGEGQRVLVLGGSGAVGSFAVQLTASLGAHTTATARTAKVEFVASLGADEVIDHATDDPLAGRSEAFDVIIDIGGRTPVRRLRRALAADGTLVMVGGEGGGPLTGGFLRQVLAPLRAIGSRQRVKAVMADEHHRWLEDLAARAVDGQIRPAIDQVHPLDHGARALTRMEAGMIRGKDVIAVAPAHSA